MARIELSKSTLTFLRQAIRLGSYEIEINDLIIGIDYSCKSITVKNQHTEQQFDLNCRDRRLIFKYFEK